MAGMLPGVECARRRRIHQISCDSPTATPSCGSTRRPSFCLYTSSHESSHLTSSLQRSTLNKAIYDEKLGAAARQAKERLDERLGTQKKSSNKRQNSSGSLRGTAERRPMGEGEMQTEVFGIKKESVTKRFSWAKLGWKSSEQDECTICLERFKSGETLVHLPCAHKFHCKCLVPWLENNSHCPCCRTQIHVEFS